MEPTNFCQSCSMPIDNMEDRGTEKDGSTNNEYCKYCYREGAFTDPAMSFEEMKKIVVAEMQKQQLPEATIDLSVNKLASLKRWQTAVN